MKVAIVGVGMETDKTLTAEARKAIDDAELLIGAGRLTGGFSGVKPCISAWSPDDVTKALADAECERAAVLMSGDVGFYSGTKKLLPLVRSLPNVSECRLICGISSPVYLAAAAGVPWERMKLVSLHGLDGNIAVNVKLNEFTFFLLGGVVTPSVLCERLCECGLSETLVTVGARLGYPDERIISGRAHEIVGQEFDKLCSAIVENSAHLAYVPSGIPDERFERSTVPMTKSEVRAAAVSKLNICSGSVCWDIGSGSGSVSVEMAYKCPDGSVYAVEHKPEAAKLTAVNARKFACDNIHVAEGPAPETLIDLPAPDKVFIGGSSGRLKEIVGIIRDKNPNADIIVTAVSLETLTEAAEILGGSVTQIAVTRTKKIGAHTMLSALNPVFIISDK